MIFDPTRKPKGNLLGIGGSPRKNGNTDVLLENFKQGAAAAGVSMEILQLRDFFFSPCIGCERCRKNGICLGLQDGMQLIYPKVVAAAGIVLASPTHNYNVTAWMKAFIDRLYCYYTFTSDRPRRWSSRLADQGRKAVVAAVCEQADPADMGFTLPAMRVPLEALGYEILSELPVFEIFDRGKVADHEAVVTEARRQGRVLAQAVAAGQS